MLTRRILAGAAAAAAALAVVAGTVAPAAASDDYTWGYGYTRIRVSDVTLAESFPDVNLLAGGPYVAPSPDPADESQSTPIVVGDALYAFAFADAQHGTLYTTTLDQQTGAPGPLRSIVSLTASAGESFDSPGDPSMSPDDEWIAYAAGYHLYWWRAGDWSHTYTRKIPPSRQGQVAFVGSGPTFVPDATPGSGGWDVCSGSSNGGFACYTVQGPPGIGPH